VFVIEESGRDALWRRLDALSRGRAIERHELRGLLLAANAGVKLDSADWQGKLLDIGERRRPRLFVFDPLARMKAPARDENAQGDMAAVIEFLRLLREVTGAAVAFVHHTGHNGGHMRGSSDLESAWETRLSWEKNEEGEVELASEHREAEPGPPLRYRIAWGGETRSMRFPLIETDAEVIESVRRHLHEHPDDSANKVFEALGGNRVNVLRAVKKVRPGGTGTSRNHPSAARSPDASGTAAFDRKIRPSRQSSTCPMASESNGHQPSRRQVEHPAR
jgi:hypothetical protein